MTRLLPMLLAGFLVFGSAAASAQSSGGSGGTGAGANTGVAGTEGSGGSGSGTSGSGTSNSGGRVTEVESRKRNHPAPKGSGTSKEQRVKSPDRSHQ